MEARVAIFDVDISESSKVERSEVSTDKQFVKKIQLDKWMLYCTCIDMLNRKTIKEQKLRGTV